EWLEQHENAEVGSLPVDGSGRLHPDALRAELAEHGDRAALVTAMWANNEVGTGQRIGEVAAVSAEYGVPFHTDAVQAVGQVPVDFAGSGV
ncbi:aminotransferase class V-fold PLP-dependent enzyme, partial [Escherichia coli]|nr:aminotransferase class V-fold PLP-dependent enzyme [Escherichia coli]